MRLDFNVLWIDDHVDDLSPQIASIARQMEQEGFAFRSRHCNSIDDINRIISDTVFSDDVDLILVDWDLGNGLKGQDVIAGIREVVRFKDVIFYSSLTSVKELRQYAFEAGAEGVFCATKPNLIIEVMGVFESLVKKVLDLDHTRGIVMGATSDIDHMVVKCLTIIDETSNELERANIHKKASDLVEKTLKNNEEKALKLKDAQTLVNLLEAHYIFTANDRLRVLNTILEAARFEGYVGLRSGLKKYISEVVPKRNDLGHLVLVPAGRPSELIDLDGKSVTVDEMRELRRFLLGFRAEFRKLRDELVGAAGQP